MCVVNELTNSSDCVNEKKYLQNELAKKGQNYDAVIRVEMSEREHEFLVTREQVQSHGGRSSLITIGQNKHSVAAVCVCVCVWWRRFCEELHTADASRQQRRRRHLPH
jgi:2-polyprenyl-3-methyl-5-hydroxy-6-metoxy-1,4-benzoquinol methylase